MIRRPQLGRPTPSTSERKIRQFPQPGYRYAASSRHVRILLHQQYRIAYLLKDDGNIDILGVCHDALDITRYKL